MRDLTAHRTLGLTGAELFFKCESFQKAGAFKARGASNAVFGLSDAQAAKGVATHSSGNHGTCLSYAAGRRGIPCTVVMPRTAPQAKKDTVRARLPKFGATVTVCVDDVKNVADISAAAVKHGTELGIFVENHPSALKLRRLHRRGTPAGTTSQLRDAIGSVVWPDDLGRAFFWGGCEHKTFRQIHRHLRHEVGLPAERQTLYSHWNHSLGEDDIIAIGAQAYLP